MWVTLMQYDSNLTRPNAWALRGAELWMTCPGCHTAGTLATPYSVEPDGLLVPSLSCSRCGWAGWLKLKDWKEYHESHAE